MLPFDPVLYPPMSRLHADFGEAELDAALRASNDDLIPRRLALGLCMPDANLPEFDSDMARLHREIGLVAQRIDRDRDVIALRVESGDDPQPFPMDVVRDLAHALRHQFHFSRNSNCEYTVRVNAGAVGARAIDGLARIGFNRIIFDGVAIVPSIVEAARVSGFQSIAAVTTGWPAAIRCAERLRPDRLAVLARNADELPQIVISRAGEVSLGRVGYIHVGLDHFALPQDDFGVAFREKNLHCGPFGFTTQRDCDSIGFGAGAVSQIGGCQSQNAEMHSDWRHALDMGRLPVLRGLRLTTDDELRGDLIEHLLCQRQIEVQELERQYAIVFRSYFAAELARLAPCLRLGLVRDEGDRIAVCSRGWPWLRRIAQCFDAATDARSWLAEVEPRHRVGSGRTREPAGIPGG